MMTNRSSRSSTGTMTMAMMIMKNRNRNNRIMVENAIEALSRVAKR